jgi:hypothetical protein
MRMQMKIKTSHAHPDAMLNHLVTSSIVKRELFFLECELNYLYSLLVKNEDISEFIEKYNKDYGDRRYVLWDVTRAELGVRGFLWEYIVDCEWDIEEFIYMHRKRLGKV